MEDECVARKERETTRVVLVPVNTGRMKTKVDLIAHCRVERSGERGGKIFVIRNGVRTGSFP
jgi:hypothetical protein